MTAVRLALAAILACSISIASAQTPVELPDLDLWNHGAVFKTEQDSSGHLLIGGLFTLAGGLPRSNIARILLPDQVIDPGFAPVVDGPVFVILEQADGKLLIGGQFGRVNGVVRNNIARLNVNGTLDTAFNPGANAPVYVLEPDGGTHVLIGGAFTQLGGQTRRGLARVALSNGAVDGAWNPNVTGGGVFAIERGASDIWIGGNFTAVGGEASRSLARLSSAGSLATAYDVNGNVEAISFDSVHGLYFCGRFTEVDSQPRSRIGRLDLTGTLDSFQIAVEHDVHSCEATDGALLVGGQFVAVNGEPVAGAARLSATGLLDPDFRPTIGGVFTGNPGTDVLVWNVRELGNGRTFIGGLFRRIGEERRVGAALVNSQFAGPLAPIHVERPAEVRALLPFEDGSLVLGGSFWRSAHQPRDNLLRVRPDGELDADWELPINGEVLSSTVASDGSLIVGGFFNAAAGQPRQKLARIILDPTPALDPDWTPGANNAVLVLQQDALNLDRLYVAGAFDSIIAGEIYARGAMARVSLSTGLPDSFDPAFNGQVNDLLQMPSLERIYAAGIFTHTGDQARRGLAAFIDSGEQPQLDIDFDAAANGNFWVLHAAETGNDFYAGGEFTSVFGQPRLRFARLGEGFEDWTPSTTGTPVAMALDGIGGLYVGGTFNSLNGVGRNLIGRLDADNGSLDPDFSPGAAPGLVWRLQIGPGRLYTAGSFQTIGGTLRIGFAAFEIETPTPPRPDLIFSDRFAFGAPDENALGLGAVPQAGVVNGDARCGVETILLGRGEQSRPFLKTPGC